jgi:hypothetical protein
VNSSIGSRLRLDPLDQAICEALLDSVDPANNEILSQIGQAHNVRLLNEEPVYRCPIGGPAAADAEKCMIGTTLAQFEITSKLGDGGMGEVWLAKDTKLRIGTTCHNLTFCRFQMRTSQCDTWYLSFPRALFGLPSAGAARSTPVPFPKITGCVEISRSTRRDAA